MYKQIQLMLSGSVVFIVIACGPPESCPECEDQDQDDASVEDGADVPARLPCNGSDLQNDDLNCGVCGQECIVEDMDTPYEAGNCSDGQCGPRWVRKYFEDTVQVDLAPPPELTCDELCAEYSTSCVAQGCSGKTGYTCMTLFGSGCSLLEPYYNRYEWTGSCTESLPWANLEVGYALQAGCCCAVTQ